MPNKNFLVLIVEDEEDLLELLTFNLEREGYSVLKAEDGLTALDVARERKPDLVLLDLMLPELDGFEVCKDLKRNELTSHIPIIMLTARGEEMDRVVGLELGADDYVVKPFSVRELLLRVRAVLRRSEENKKPSGVLRHGPLTLEVESHMAMLSGEEIPLTATEFKLLEDLMRHAGTVRKREQLLDSIWGYSFEGYGRTVDTHVRRLRIKLGPVADYLETIRGVGYRFKTG
ncbi:response regulator [Desulfovibrio sp. OttesenSCG-928-C14]|nr:response regulator [Desulfovibrio sp. OttesenSCG-928-C14]